MKTISRISAAVLTAILVLASCAKEDLLEGKATETVAAGTRVIAVSFSNSATKSELGTNGVTPKFVNGDKIMVSNGADTEECTVNCKGDVASISPKLTGALTLVYPAAVWSDSEPYFKVPATQDGTFASANISTATIEAEAESALFEHQTAVLRFYVDASIGVKSFTVTSSTADIADGAKTITVDPDGDATLDTVTDDPGKRICYVAVLPTTSATDLTFTSVTTTQTAYPANTVTRNVASVSLVKNRIYDAFVPYYIDLGANGKWGYCNIGAFLPEDYGDYFAWGEINGHKLNADKTATADGHSFDWSTAPFNGGASDFDGTYFNSVKNTECPDGVLALKNDAANVNWGGYWRMPTLEEFETIQTNSALAYIGGCLVFDNKLSLPCTGAFYFTELGGDGNNAYYWSSSIHSSYFNCAGIGWIMGDSFSMDWVDRFRGITIRPIYDVPYVPPVPEPLPGLFSVSATKKVQFSPGNLYWDGDSYEFEAHQYDYPTTWDTHHVGHFFWVKNTETSIKPYDANYGTPSPSNSFDDIFFTNATENSANAGFTVSGVTGKYRTLSNLEWNYLLSSRTVNGGTKNGYSYSVNITYCGKTGLVIYPDGYSGSPLVVGTDYSELPEGVAFLPAAAYIDGGSFSEVGTGDYWASNTKTAVLAFYQRFPDRVGDGDTNFKHSYASAVRLVVDADNPIPPIPPFPDPIDLGLSVKWGSFNLGATKPEEYGDYFMWGEVKGHTPDLTLPKNGTGIIVNAFEEDFESFDHADARYTGSWVAADGFNYDNSPFFIYGEGYTKYTYSNTNPSGKKILDPEDDAAHVILGEGWRMPTKAELSELFEYTDKEWTSDYEGTGVSGWIFKKKAGNDKFVFLPSAGFSFDLGLSASNSQCMYWSSELYEAADPEFASSMYFDSVEVTWGQSGRYEGFPIRPVYDPVE